MTKETLQGLASNTLIGYTEKRGKAWWYRASTDGAESNHYEGAIPVEDVRRRLFDWTPLEAEVTATALTPDGVLQVTDPSRKAIVRPDTGAILGIFKQGYRVHGYDEWLIQNVETLLDADVAIGSAGLLKGGAVAWVQVEMEDTITTREGVEFRPFLTAATSLDGSLATTYQTGAQVVVCDNTLSAALREDAETSARVKIKHSVNSLNRLGDVRDSLGIIHAVADEFQAQVDALTSQVVTDAQWSAFVDAYTTSTGNTEQARTKAANRAGELHRLYRHDERVAPWAGTAYGVVAATNTYGHHVQTVRGASRVERNMERAVTGGWDKADRQALALLATV